ncbi:AMP-dependent synthetase/ligase [Fulvivirga lutea]|uniref:Long-chain fatty acid--CoA ligase n=1 Tax=Fulvivirga lutea TaxID=2810512 RepID=A0A975A1S6_9BACT|nr:long-chain fatty acid--CoA ligase [Fulvivirga lutea]QSE98141.1 long-chain fatty acid--CoA ligase [Fulvivirga lutea]
MEINRLFDTLDYQLEECPLDDSLANKVDGKWQTISTQEFKELVNQLSAGLINKEVQKDDKVGIVSFNRPEWVITDFAVTQIGAIGVPMYPNSTPGDYAFIINDASIKRVFCGDVEICEKIESVKDKLNQPVELYCFDENQKFEFWKNLFKQPGQSDIDEINARRDSIKTEDLATIIYTSGTTGNPKGVMLSHKNILSNSASVEEIFPNVEKGYRTLSFLPLCHIFERTGLYTYMRLGVSIYYAESMDTIGENLKEVKPQFFATVPRLLEKVYDKIVAKGYSLTGIKKQLFFWALQLGDKYEPNKSHSFIYKLKLAIANKLIFSKWREALGGNVQFIVSGAAALQPRLARVFWSAQIKILEAYGLTETSPGISFTRDDPKDVRIGCVGPLLPRVEVKFGEDGEILAKGPSVMMGYFNRPDATAEVLDSDGWFHTGDIGEMVEGRYLKITDRKKEIFKTSGGKYIAPQLIENKFKESTLIEQVMVIGEGEKFPSALVVPAFEVLRDWCEIKKINYTTDIEMIAHERVLKKFQKEVDRLNKSFAQYEKIKKIKLLPTSWTIESGELTPTLKLKRKVILSKYQADIDSLYA